MTTRAIACSFAVALAMAWAPTSGKAAAVRDYVLDSLPAPLSIPAESRALAIDSAGHGVVVWARTSGGVFARFLATDGKPRRLLLVSPDRRRVGGVSAVPLGRGRILAAWGPYTSGAPQSAVFSAHGRERTIGLPPGNIAPGFFSQFAPARGGAFCLTVQGDRLVLYRLTAGATHFRFMGIVSSGGFRERRAPEVFSGTTMAGDGSGGLVLAWIRRRSETADAVEARTFSPAGRLGRVRTLQVAPRVPGGDFGDPDIPSVLALRAVRSASGHGLVEWFRFEPSLVDGRQKTMAAVTHPGGAVGAAALLSARAGGSVAIGMARDGAATVLVDELQIVDGKGIAELVALSGMPGRLPSRRHVLARGGSGHGGLGLGVGARGQAAAIWTGGGGTRTRFSIRRSPGGAFAPLDGVTLRPKTAIDGGPLAFVRPDGSATLVYVTNAGHLGRRELHAAAVTAAGR